MLFLFTVGCQLLRVIPVQLRYPLVLLNHLRRLQEVIYLNAGLLRLAFILHLTVDGGQAGFFCLDWRPNSRRRVLRVAEFDLPAVQQLPNIALIVLALLEVAPVALRLLPL